MHNYCAAFAMVLGIFLGTTLWFTSLSWTAYSFRHKITLSRLNTINKFFGICLIVFGFFIAAKMLF
jgi:threonine/homoserine/homoserine lactone efflux protein